MQTDITLLLSQKDPLKIQVDTKNYKFLRGLKEYFTDYAPDYIFSPKYQAGVWDGRICLFETTSRQFPYGLLKEFLKYKKEWPELSLSVDKTVKDLFLNEEPIYNWNLKWPPRPYQEESIRAACKYSKALIKVPTAGGKSLILAYIWKSLFESDLISKQIIIVPNTSLTSQFKSDWVSYGIPEKYIGEVWAEEKDWNKKVVISTWQSLKNNLEMIKNFDSLFVDETHLASAAEITNILQNSPAKYRIGCTGTLPDFRLLKLNIHSYLGPLVANYTARQLTEWGYIADCVIKQIKIHYDKNFSGDFHKVKKEIFQQPFRMRFIKDLIKKEVESGPALVLVGKVEDEGQYLKNYLLETNEFSDWEIVFIYGNTKKDEREYWRLRAAEEGRKVLIISTYPVFQQGINIPNLSYVFFAAPFKSKIRILQSIGRALRLHDSKILAKVYDIIDLNNKWFEEHGDIRLKHYLKEEFNVENIDVYEEKVNFF